MIIDHCTESDIMGRPPQVLANCDRFPSDPAARAEVELGLFGQHLFFMRNQRVASIERLLEDQEARDRIGAIRRKAYDAVANSDKASRSAAVKLAETAIDLYIQDLLELLSNLGSDLRAGNDYAIRYRLIMEIVNLEHHVLWEDTINRGSVKHLPKYFGEWLNKFKNWGMPMNKKGGSTASEV